MNLYSILRNSDNVLTNPGEILLQRNNMIVNVPDESILYTLLMNQKISTTSFLDLELYTLAMMIRSSTIYQIIRSIQVLNFR